eukprot:753114-Pyramimonas_sp.AAC.1
MPSSNETEGRAAALPLGNCTRPRLPLALVGLHVPLPQAHQVLVRRLQHVASCRRAACAQNNDHLADGDLRQSPWRRPPAVFNRSPR